MIISVHLFCIVMSSWKGSQMHKCLALSLQSTCIREAIFPASARGNSAWVRLAHAKKARPWANDRWMISTDTVGPPPVPAAGMPLVLLKNPNHANPPKQTLKHAGTASNWNLNILNFGYSIQAISRRVVKKRILAVGQTSHTFKAV